MSDISTTYQRAGIEPADIEAHLAGIAGRLKTACGRMTAIWFRSRRDPAGDILPADCPAPELPGIPDLPAAYTTALRKLDDYDRGTWETGSDRASPIHRDRLPRALRADATPEEIVRALGTIREWICRVESITDDYVLSCEEAAAAHIAAQEGHVRALAAIVADQRAAREAAAEEAARAEAEAEEARAAEAAGRREWILAHGSERLRRAHAEGIECQAIYRDERLALERPGWEWASEAALGGLKEPRNPPLAALDLLAEARAAAADARLAFTDRFRPATSEDDPDTVDEDGDVREAVYAAAAEFLGSVIVTVRRVPAG